MTAFWNFLTEDWYFAVPLLGLSFIGVTLVLWRLLLNWDASARLTCFLPAFRESLRRDGMKGALRFCEAEPGAIPHRLTIAGLHTAAQGITAMRRAMAEVIYLDILPELSFLLAPILAIAKVATMLGLLGTVISMIGTFTILGQESTAGGTAHAASIGLALFATALGLVTAIPLVFAHVLFKSWLHRYEVRLKDAAQELLEMLAQP